MNVAEQLRPLLAKIELVHRWSVMRGETRMFNIFSLLKDDYDEVGLHTVYLNVLLDPRGSHGLGSAFLALFLEQIGLGFTHQTDFKDTVIERERRRSGMGQIDLLIEFPRAATVVVIENKIHAEDQENQLERYHSHAYARVGTKGTVVMVYLTLHGTAPSPESLGSLSQDEVKCISYSDDILYWISRCIEKASLHPPLRETLIQYAELIRKITGQSMSEETREEILTILSEGKNAELAQMVVANWRHMMWRSTWAFWQELEASIKRLSTHFPALQILETNKYSEYTLNRLYFYQRGKDYDFGLVIKLGLLAGTEADELCLCLCISDEGGPAYYGLVILRDGKWTGIQRESTFDSLATGLHPHFSENSRNDWWIGHRHFKSRALNFIEYGDADTLALANPLRRAETIELVYSEIEECLTKSRIKEALLETISQSPVL